MSIQVFPVAEVESLGSPGAPERAWLRRWFPRAGPSVLVREIELVLGLLCLTGREERGRGDIRTGRAARTDGGLRRPHVD
jgi:hypothetical protein